MQVEENEAVARGRNLPISRKHAREIGEFIKGDPVERAEDKLERVVEKELPVPYRRHNKEQPHRKGDMASGRYPVKAAGEVKNLLNSAKHNALDQGFSEDLHISGFMVNQGNRFQTPKRQRGRRPKRTHVTIKVRER